MASGDREPVPMLENVDFIDDEEDITDEDDIVHSSSPDAKFDTVIGHIEDIIVGDEFQNLQEKFMEENYEEFEDTDENKLCYTEIHQKYIDGLEKYLENELIRRMPNFTMEEFSEQMMERKDELDGEVFEMLFTFTDFVAFKELMLDYKKSQCGNVGDLSLGITVTPLTPRGCGDSGPPRTSRIGDSPFQTTSSEVNGNLDSINQLDLLVTNALSISSSKNCSNKSTPKSN